MPRMPKAAQPDLFARPQPSSSRIATDSPEATMATSELILDRQQHPAWQLLAAHRAPLIIGCLKPLFKDAGGEIPLEDARTALTKLLTAHANNPDFDIHNDDFPALARKEIREWIRKGLLVERGGLVFATDALQSAFRFVESIRERMMTSTASRLATVQQRIETLEARMNPDKEKRSDYLKQKINELEAELAKVQSGDFEVLEGEQAGQEIREVYSLATSLRADFRRVEDSYREADHELRQSIIRDDNNRGQVVQRLLSANEALVRTPEGQVFSGFYEQIARSNELDKMRHRIRRLLDFEGCAAALSPEQASELRSLVSRLIDESENVMRARARSEKDVRGFIKTGLAGEHHRVGKLLDEIAETVLKIDWSQQNVRRTPAPLYPIAPGLGQVPAPERIIYKSLDDDEAIILNLEEQKGALDALEESYLESNRELDRVALYEKTLAWLSAQKTPKTVADLAEALPPEYDLETLNFWLNLARESELPFGEEEECVILPTDTEDENTRFFFPRVELQANALADIIRENIE
ncbi:MAG: DUF3375 domain-containing protein [Puniceicoccaceae bacterium]|nr:MAG: DUF3375 domain-containing protein [Puniceicoccaceae bacterium]